MSKKRRKPVKKVPAPNKAVQQALTDLVIGMLSGQQETVSVPITLTIPKGLHATYQAVAAQYGVPIEEFLEAAAKEGIERALLPGVMEPPKAQESLDPLTMAKAAGIDTSSITEGFNKIKDIGEQMKQLEGLFNERIDIPNIK